MRNHLDMKLPKVNQNEELEDISNNKFVPLLDVEKFEVRKEPGRDKGIDFRIEIKKDGVYTGFRFLIQMKATEKIARNSDNSISIPIDTSNINYLLNAGIPAYYCLFFKKDNVFLFENINDFVKRLSENHEDWQQQDSHTLRLTEKLTEVSFNDMYKNAYERGLCFRNLNQKLAESSSIVSEKMIVDEKLNVVGDSEIRRRIEGLGLYLINELRSAEVVKMHEKGSQQIATTAKYNMAVGIAYYYIGELVKSLDFIKAAIKRKEELSNDLLEHLMLFDISVRFALGLISKGDHNQRLSTLNSNHIKYYALIQNAKELYLKSMNPDVDQRYSDFVTTMENILKADDASENIKLMVQCELVLYEGSRINMEYAQGIATIKAYESMIGENRQLRNDVLEGVMQKKFSWGSKASEIKKTAQDSGNHFVFCHVLINESKVNYEFEVYTDLVNFDNPSGLPAFSSDKLEQLNSILTNLDYAGKYYEAISHIDNLCVVLSVQYEVLHYKKDYLRATTVLNRLSDMIETYEYRDFKSKFDSLKSAGTTHEKLVKFYDDIFAQSHNKQQEYEQMLGEMQRMDELDADRHGQVIEPYTIELFPIGHFQFPKNLSKDVFSILNISESARRSFESMWDEIKEIPVANIYRNPISEEGYADVLRSSEINTLRNIYRIRKEFFDRGFRRVDLNI
jgi:hypothetical protein